MSKYYGFYVSPEKMLYATRCVTEQRGSWRYQDAHRSAYYAIRKRIKPGGSVFVWKTAMRSSKYAITKKNPLDRPTGTLNQKPVTGEQLMAMALICELEGSTPAMESMNDQEP